MPQDRMKIWFSGSKPSKFAFADTELTRAHYSILGNELKAKSVKKSKENQPSGSGRLSWRSWRWLLRWKYVACFIPLILNLKGEWTTAPIPAPIQDVTGVRPGNG